MNFRPQYRKHFQAGLARGMGPKLRRAAVAAKQGGQALAFGAGRLAGSMLRNPLVAGIGGVAAGATAAAAALFTLSHASMQFAEHQLESQRKYVSYNVETAVAFMNYDIRGMFRDIKIAKQTSGSTAALAQATADIQDSFSEYRAAGVNVKNTFARTVALGGSTVFKLFDFLPKAVNEAFDGQRTEGAVLTEKYWEQLSGWERLKFQARATFGGKDAIKELAGDVDKWAKESGLRGVNEDPIGDALREITLAKAFGPIDTRF